MRLLNQTKKIPQYIRDNGIANFVIYMITTTLLTGFSWLLFPFKKNPRTDTFYQVFNHFTHAVNEMQHPALLEIGSRNVTGVVWREVFSPTVKYTGMDIHPGENVDVVGDVHALSTHLPGNHYDAIFSVSVFEHLAMP
ncbi:MAG: class I SAM-dependent methyltransferase [Candidatus Thiodiazotropha endolucinida]